jgi:hypothetical protein
VGCAGGWVANAALRGQEAVRLHARGATERARRGAARFGRARRRDERNIGLGEAASGTNRAVGTGCLDSTLLPNNQTHLSG